MNKGRLEAFTDAAVAIAETIAVLEVKPPLTNDQNVIKEILPTLPAYMAIAFIVPYVSLYMIGAVSVVMIARGFAANREA